MIMTLYNPYTHQSIEYDLDLSRNNIRMQYYIRHETCFCNYYTQWLVLNLRDGNMIYIPSDDKNRRNIYVVTHEYISNMVKYPYGIYTIKYSDFLIKS